MGSTPHILVLIDTELRRAPRAQTMIRAAKTAFRVTVAALEKDAEDGYDFIRLQTGPDHRENFHFGYPWLIRKSVSAGLKLRRGLLKIAPALEFERVIWNETAKMRLAQLEHLHFDAIIVHHAHNLPLASRLAKKWNARLFMNAHEYYPLEFDHDANWVRREQRRVKYICDRYLPYVETVFAASPGYAKAYEEKHGAHAQMVPCVKPFIQLAPRPVGNKIKLVHQGFANPDRKIETMLEMMSMLDERFELYLHLMPTEQAYYDRLQEMAAAYPNVHFLKPFKPEELVEALNQYDIGVYILEPTNFNTTWMLPNKIFEFIQARLATAISPAKGMIPYLEEHGFGLISEDHTAASMAARLNALTTAEIDAFKQRADEAALTTSAETYYPLIRETLAKALAYVRN